MRSIEPSLTDKLRAHVGSASVSSSAAYEISTYRQLVEQVARLSYLNKDYLTFFRGQSHDYLNKAGSSTFYPSIYRGEKLIRKEIEHRFDVLDESARQLRDLFRDKGVEGHLDVTRKRFIQWSILQHYEVCSTPLLDFTQSLRVACSFAQQKDASGHVYIFVFGLPYLSNRISIHSEHDVVNVRLLSICPPDALRPYFQEGYLAGTPDVAADYDSKDELDFNRRLIAKFAIPNTKQFWGRGMSPIPRTALYPSGDRIEKLCQEIRAIARTGTYHGELGEFVAIWSEIEEVLIGSAQRVEDRMVSVPHAIRTLMAKGEIPEDTAMQLDQLRRLRNEIVHRASHIDSARMKDALAIAKRTRSALQNTLAYILS